MQYVFNHRERNNAKSRQFVPKQGVGWQDSPFYLISCFEEGGKEHEK